MLKQRKCTLKYTEFKNKETKDLNSKLFVKNRFNHNWDDTWIQLIFVCLIDIAG